MAMNASPRSDGEEEKVLDARMSAATPGERKIAIFILIDGKII